MKIPSLEPKESYNIVMRLSVKMLASWFDNDTCGVKMAPFNTLLQMK